MALPAAQQLTVELVPHCTSVVRDGWAGSHDVRPLSEAGMRQAEALVAAIGANVDGIYSSPTARCRQTVWGAPLACPGCGTSAVAAGTRCGSHPASSPSPRMTRFRSDSPPYVSSGPYVRRDGRRG
jgi:hypothetical protein